MASPPTRMPALAAAALIRDDPSDLTDCGPGATHLLHHLATHVDSPSPQLLSRANSLLLLSRQKLHAYPYQDVPPAWRRLYTDASIVKAAVLLLRGPAHHTDAIHTLDLALILAGAPGPHRRSTIHTLLESIPTAAAAAEAPALTKNPIRDPPPTISHPIPRLPRPSLHAFQTHLDTQDSPLIVTHALTHWRALASWPHPRYLLSLTHGGRRLVPVEVGRAYTDSGWGQRIIPFAEFWSTFMGADAAEKGYLAQHTLLSQVPALRDDIAIPDYCYTTPPATGAPALEEPLIHAWLGPRGTVSPLHTDPYANMLAQVVGSKYVRVYAPGERVFPRGVEAGGVDMGNTSRGEVEVEGGGLEEEEERRVWGETSYLEAVLEPGEVLFIPAGWWHYVRSLEESFSVSFWWN